MMEQQKECKSMKQRVEEALKILPPDAHGEFFAELKRAKGVILDLEGTLGACTKDTVSEKLRTFAQQIPEFKYLTEERAAALALVEQVCTGAVDIPTGLAILYDTDKQFTDAMVLSVS
ncbi:MAG: hypothetical protein HFJ28_01425 [Clostridia bacterium]|jgi:hypothetical protein|nr:hypothetical protein [Clostridia bacterium]